MSVQSICTSLRGKGKGGSGGQLFDLLFLAPSDGLAVSPSDSPHKAARIVLLEVAKEEVMNAMEPSSNQNSAYFAKVSEEFWTRIRSGLLRASEWLNARPLGSFDRCRDQGFELDVFFDAWIDNDLFDLELPVEFLAACGKAGLPIVICTND
jgi:hypothetical protein